WLNDGKILLSGGATSCSNGSDGCFLIAAPKIYDPATGKITGTGDYADQSVNPLFGNPGLAFAPAILLPDGKVLIETEPTAELYDPTTSTFAFTDQMTGGTKYGRQVFAIGGTQTLLMNGKVLLAGGEEFEFAWLDDAELYDPSTGKFTAIQNMTGIRSG